MPRSSARVARVLSKLGFSLGFSSSKLALAFSKQENGVATGSVSSVSVLRAVLEAGTRPKSLSCRLALRLRVLARLFGCTPG